MKRRIFSLLLCMVLCVSIFPAGAFAGDDGLPEEIILEEELPEEELPEEELPEEELPEEELPEEELREEELPEEELPEEELPEEELPEEELSEEEPTDELMAVSFECDEAEDLSALAVYDAEGAVVPPVTDADTGETLYGRYSLLPGEYSYSFYAEGFEPLENVPFTVTDADLTVTVILTALSEEEQPEAFMMLTALSGGEPGDEFELTFAELQAMLDEESAIRLSALLSALGLSVEMADVTAVETSDESVFTAVKDAEGDDWTLNVLQAPAPQASISVTVGGVEHKIIVTNDVDGTIIRWENVSYIDANGSSNTANCIILYDQFDEPLTTGWYTVGGEEAFINPLIISGDVHLILKDDCSFHPYRGEPIYFRDCARLTIYGQEAGSGRLTAINTLSSVEGKLTVNGGKVDAPNLNFALTVVNRGLVTTGTVFGNGLNVNGGAVTADRVPANVTVNNGSLAVKEEFSVDNVTVNNGVVTAPGIHANYNVTINGGVLTEIGSIYGKNVTITGGEVTATGGENTPGIGCAPKGTIKISGGTVTATGGEEATGIGSGSYGNVGTIIISGGTVTATGHKGGAGIGGGFHASSESITISGGTVTATGHNGGAGIGGGSLGNAGTITISGGTVTAFSDIASGIGGGIGGTHGSFSLENSDLALCAGRSREAAHSTTAEKYSETRDYFVFIGPKTGYTVSHHWELTDGTGYEENEQESLYGIAGFLTDAKQKTCEGFTCEGVTQQTVAADGSTVVPIKYKRNLYDIVFDNQGVGTAPEKLTARFGAEVTVDPGAMEAAGYVFNGWFEDEACTKQFSVPQPVTMPLNGFTLYAGWTAKTDTKYNVEHRQQKADGTGYDLAETITMTGTSGQQTAAEAKDYPGFTAEEFEQKPIRGDGSTVIEIKYDRNSYTLTFSANGHGTAPAALTALYGAPVAKPADPEAPGYTFGGWFEDEACTKAFTFTVMPLGGKTLYAKWTANVYNVTFEGNFTGSTYSKVIEQTYGETYVFPEDDPERAGYNFTGWYTKASKGEEIEPGDKFPFSNEIETLTVYAHWRQVPHAYGPATYKWEGDSCTATRICTKCPEPHTQTETVTGFYVEDTPATCLTASKGHYRAIFANAAFAEQNTAANSVTKGEPLGHSYGDAAYTWDDNKCTATRKCIRCDLSESETATGVYVKDTDSACLAAETGHYKATFTNPAFAEQSTARGSVTRGEPLGHSYGDAFYAWNEDKCTATRICTRCDVSESETSTGSYVKDTDATCVTAETGHYKATFKNAAFAGQSTAKGSVTKGEPLGHSYGDAAYAWNEDRCTAERKCIRCEASETETATGSYVKDTDATCTEAEKGHYKATFTNTAFTEQSTASGSVTRGEPLGHAFPEEWQQFGAQQHMRRCTREGCRIYDFEDHSFSGDKCKCGYEKKTLQISVSGGPYCDGASTAVNLAFTLNGAPCAVTYPKGLTWHELDPSVDYLTAVDAPDAGAKLEAGKTYVTQFLVKVPFSVMPVGSTAVPEIVSDFFTVGCTPAVEQSTYYEMRLTLLFTLTPPHAELVQFPGKAATCTESGVKDCWYCTVCERYYEDEACKTLIENYETWKKGAGIIPASHSYGDAAYAWDEDRCTATHECTVCAEGTPGHTESETVTGSYAEDTPATCTTASKGHYKATFTNTAFAEQNTEPNSVTRGGPLGHSYGAAAYTWNDDKCTATHKCTRCAEGTEGHTETETATGSYVKDTDATCTEAEKGHYKAAFENEAFRPQSTARGSVIKGDPLGHSYGDAFYAWDEDRCTAEHICTRCEADETETATGVYTKDTDATCTEAEKGQYTAEFENEAFEPQSISVTVGEPLGHAFPETWLPYSAQQHMRQCTREGCTAYDYEDHSFHGNTCTVCGYAKSDRYLIIAGADGVWTKRDSAALPFTSNAPFDRFVSVKVDGDDIPESCYSAEEGSTKVNLLPAYLETLSLGQHSIDVVSNDGTASTFFTVKPVPVYTVSFNMKGHGTQVPAQHVEKGSAASRPADPQVSGYTFTGWYVDSACTAKYDFSAPVTGDTVLYARWVKGNYPKTGDDSGLALWAAVFSAGVMALAGGAVLAKKKKPEKQDI